MSNDDYVLRPEAGPVGPALLNRSQREAFSAIVEALAEANRLAGKSVELAGGRGAVQRDRVSRLFFVSGEPGSGKTSLYLTLRAILDQQEPFAELRKEYEKEFELYKGLSELVDRTRWLECIDLEVAVDEGENLLAAVLVRIFHAIGDSFGASHNCQQALQQLEELANDIGIAWDGNLKARAGSLDPDSYSQEVIRAQGTRLRINERFRTPLETLFEKQCFGLKPEQLFVLPIDDFYLKPAASLELLRLLSMISVPRLFFLIMGDIKSVEALFFEKALADWTAVAGPRIFASLADRQQDVLARVREMKARYLRKLLPIGQRAVIDWTEWNETLGYRPAASRDAVWVPQMCHLLSGVDIFWHEENDEEERTLLNFLLAPRHPKPRENKDYCDETTEAKILKKFREAYSGLLILDATPRELFDLWRVLRKLHRDDTSETRAEFNGEEAPRYLRMFVELALSAIEEQNFLEEKHQETLRFVFPPSNRANFIVRTDELLLAQKVGPWRSTSSGEVWVRRHLDWELRIANTEAKPDRSEGKLDQPGEKSDQAGDTSGRSEGVSSGRDDALPPRLAAWIILLHDLVWNWKRDHLVENLVHSLHGRIVANKPKMNPPRPVDAGWAWYMDKKKQWVHFPFPEFDTFRQLDRFLAIWSYSLDTCLSGSDFAELKKATLEKAWNEAEKTARDTDDEFYKFVHRMEKSKSSHSA